MKLNIYMKSGNKITMGNVKNYEIGNSGNEITKIFIERGSFWGGGGERLLVKTIDLSQIEAVTVS